MLLYNSYKCVAINCESLCCTPITCLNKKNHLKTFTYTCSVLNKKMLLELVKCLSLDRKKVKISKEAVFTVKMIIKIFYCFHKYSLFLNDYLNLIFKSSSYQHINNQR